MIFYSYNRDLFMPTIHMDTGFFEKPCNTIIYVDGQYLSFLVVSNLEVRNVHTNIQIPLLKSSRPFIKHLCDTHKIHGKAWHWPDSYRLIRVVGLAQWFYGPNPKSVRSTFLTNDDSFKRNEPFFGQHVSREKPGCH